MVVVADLCQLGTKNRNASKTIIYIYVQRRDFNLTKLLWTMFSDSPSHFAKTMTSIRISAKNPIKNNLIIYQDKSI